MPNFVLLKGGFANVVFQIIFGLKLEMHTGRPVYFLDRSLSSSLSAIVRSIFISSRFSRFPRGVHLLKFIFKNRVVVDNMQAPFSFFYNKGGIYEGYFQDLDFLSEYNQSIFDYIFIRLSDLYKLENYVDKPAVIHFRDSDDLDYNTPMIFKQLHSDYFQDGIQLLSVSKDLLVVTGDICNASNSLEMKGLPHLACSDDFIDDFLRIMVAEKAIISNSAFPHLARLLSRAPRINTVSPRYWFDEKAGLIEPNISDGFMRI